MHLLNSIRGEYIDRLNYSTQSSTFSRLLHRRFFVDSFAYLCDCKKNSDIVTNIALQTASYDIIIHVAANQHVNEKMKEFISF